MILNSIKIFLLFLVLGFIASCEKPTDLIPNEPFEKSSFPVKVGNWWRYKVTDFYSNSSDTLIITVSSSYQTNDTTLYRCDLTINGSLVDTSIIMFSTSEITYKGLNPDYSYFGDFKLKLPFNQGDSWNGFYVPDTVYAISKIDSFIVSGKAYKPVYNIKRSFILGGGYKLTQFIKLSPGVGVINQSIDLFNGFNVQKQDFQLIDYDLN